MRKSGDRSKLTEEQKARMVAEYNNTDITLDQLAKKYGLSSRNSVRYYIVKAKAEPTQIDVRAKDSSIDIAFDVAGSSESCKLSNASGKWEVESRSPGANKATVISAFSKLLEETKF